MSESDKLLRFVMEQEETARTVARLVRESEQVRARVARTMAAQPFAVRERLDGRKWQIPEC